MANRTTGALFVMAALAIPSAAMAQRWGRDPFPGSGACFFRDSEFRGEYFCVRAGENVWRVPDEMNDRISSIRTFGRAEVIVFSDIRFGGGSMRLDHSIRDLRDERWNDRISSLRVEFERRDGDFRGRPDDRDHFDDRGRFDDRDRGRPDERRDRVDYDQIVRRAYQDILGRDPDDAGLRQYRSKMTDEGWNEAQVRDSLRASPEYREKTTMTRPKAQEIVRRAYLNVLKREPDPGAEGWVQNVLTKNWLQEDVERQLRTSAEYRQKNR